MSDHALSQMHEVHISRSVLVFFEAEDVDIMDVVGRYGMFDLVVLEILEAFFIDLRLFEP